MYSLFINVNNYIMKVTAMKAMNNGYNIVTGIICHVV